MAQCCNNYYQDCIGLTPCFEVLYIKVPIEYVGLSIDLRFVKDGEENGPVLRANVVIENGWAVVESTLFPKGWLNPYSTYRVEFWLFNLVILEFTAKDSKEYTGINFSFENNSVAAGAINLNAIDNTTYE